jgi:hypothetical protein
LNSSLTTYSTTCSPASLEMGTTADPYAEAVGK